VSAHLGVVYVPRSSAEYLEIGVSESVWGFSKELIARSNYLEEFRRLFAGDLLFLGCGGPLLRRSASPAPRP
jgi:hypothetical protein